MRGVVIGIAMLAAGAEAASWDSAHVADAIATCETLSETQRGRELCHLSQIAYAADMVHTALEVGAPIPSHPLDEHDPERMQAMARGCLRSSVALGRPYAPKVFLCLVGEIAQANHETRMEATPREEVERLLELREESEEFRRAVDAKNAVIPQSAPLAQRAVERWCEPTDGLERAAAGVVNAICTAEYDRLERWCRKQTAETQPNPADPDEAWPVSIDPEAAWACMEQNRHRDWLLRRVD